MPSLRQLLAAHAPVLLIDAASSCVQAGWLRNDGSGGAHWATSHADTGVGLFTSLATLSVDVGEAGAFVFCDGPGSVLGIRTCAMALRTWNVLKPRPMFSYCSLAIVSHALGRSGVTVVADARRELWHQFVLGGKLRRVSAGELTGELVMPENFRHWSQPPPGLTQVPYSLSDLLPRVIDADLFHATDSPDAFLHEEPSYVTWTPKIHRAPSAT